MVQGQKGPQKPLPRLKQLLIKVMKEFLFMGVARQCQDSVQLCLTLQKISNLSVTFLLKRFQCLLTIIFQIDEHFFS